jgi:PKD domain
MKSPFAHFLRLPAFFQARFIWIILMVAGLLLTPELRAQQSNCHANFSSSLDSCPTINFSDLSITSGFVLWAWTFGDGGVSNLQSPSHTYTSNGLYEVCLNILVDFNCSSSFCAFVTVECMDCEAGFHFAMPNCPTVNFTDASVPPVGTVTAWSWTFGDGATDSVANPSHTFAANGTYSVCLQTVTDAGCVASRCQNVTVNCIVGVAEPAQNFTVQVAPNPLAGDQIALAVTAADPGMLDCALFAIDGRCIHRWEVAHGAGLEHLRLDLPIKAGVYALRVTDTNGETRVLQVVKQ